MPFNLNYPIPGDPSNAFALSEGELIFVLGANGTGKSSLMHRFATQNQGQKRKISAHRQTWMNSDALDLTPSSKLQTEKHIQNEEQQIQSRYKDSFAAARASMTVYELIDAENVRARAIAAAVDSDDLEQAKEAAKAEAPIAIINELLEQSNIPISITIEKNERVMASKNGGPKYSAAELSDGERNALLIAGNVLTAPPGYLLIIDEPERHLHRSIIAPLLSQLFERRSDCGFVISTHDHDLPLQVPGARAMLLRSCIYNGSNVESWEADLLPRESPIDETLKRELLGARRKILFVEGTESSLDKPLYSILFPMVSIIPKGSCGDVENAVSGVSVGEGFHWLRAFGIVDGDGFTNEQKETKARRGVFPLDYYSVEAIYFHPVIIEKVAGIQADVVGADPAELKNRAIDAGIAAVANHTERLSLKSTKKAVRKLVLEQIPNDEALMNGDQVTLENDAAEILQTRMTTLNQAVAQADWETILVHCPIRESSAISDICRALNFQTSSDYFKAVRRLLSQDQDTLQFARTLFGPLFENLEN